MMIFALVAITSCGNKTTNSAASDADSIVINEVSDTLNIVEAVVKQVNAVYARRGCRETSECRLCLLE